MPELPEVETTLRGIAPHLVGQKATELVVRQSRLRWPITDNLAELIAGRHLLGVVRRGKYLLLDFGNGHALIHLGMSGSLRIVKAD